MNPSTEALAMFADFGTDATLDGAAVRGLFDNEHAQDLNLMLGSNPVFTCLSSVALNSRGKTLIVDGTSYTVREVKPDGTGFSLLELEAQ